MAPDPLIEDDDYASEEDSDFAPDAVPANDASDASDSDNDGDGQVSSAKRKQTDEGVRDEDFENSGDEAIIEKGKKRQKKRKKTKQQDGGTADDQDDEGGGEGGLIKTRSMRAVEKAERKTHAITGPVTVDVDDLWARMMATPVVPSKTTANQADSADDKENREPVEIGHKDEENLGASQGDGDGSRTSDPPAMIKIKRTYNFAGKVHTEEKLVQRDSAEAKLYIASLDPKAAAEVLGESRLEDDNDEDEAQKRQPRKAFRSAFEPAVEAGLAGAGGRSDLNLGVAARLQMREQQRQSASTKKLNVVEKSRMDWAGYVDQEGIQDELALAGRSKASYANRQDFLARSEAKREEEARRARLAGKG